MSKSLKIIHAINKIYPSIKGGFSYWESKADGSPFANPIEGLVWDNKQFTKPSWEEIEDNMESDLEYLKKLIISMIKAEAGRRIVVAYPEWKQRNHMAAVIDIQNKELVALKSNTTYTPSADEIATITAAQTAKNQVFAIRAKSDQLEASLDSMTLAELEAFDPTNDSNWI